MRQQKMLGILFTVAVTTSLAAFIIKKMTERIDNKELAKNVGTKVVYEVVDQVRHNEV